MVGVSLSSRLNRGGEDDESEIEREKECAQRSDVKG